MKTLGDVNTICGSSFPAKGFGEPLRFTRKEKRRLAAMRYEQKKIMIALKRARKMDRELSAILRDDFTGRRV